MIYLIVAALAGAFAYAVSRNLFMTAGNAVLGFAITYLGLPVMAINHWDPYFLALVLTAPVAGLSIVLNENRDAKITKISAMALGVSVSFFCAVVLIAFLTSASIFRAGDYAALIGEIDQVDQQALTERLESFDQTQARFVDQGLAENRAEELLGVQTGLASRVSIATPSIQSVDGRLTWIGGLEYTGFKKWSSNGHTPGYYQIDQTNRQNAEMVLEYEMTCIPSAFFSEDLDRLIYEAGYWNIGFTDQTLEVDDSGKPFWVVSLYEHKVGFLGSDAVGVLVVDPVSCEIAEYGLEEAPGWIDRVHPADFLETQLSDWGVYRHGWWNAFWSESEPTMDTTAGEAGEAGLYFVRTKDGEPAWYTGMQSTKADRGTQGYVVADARTKKSTYYAFAGVTEQAVQEAMLGIVAEKEGYSVTYPIPYNINGHLTHVAVLKDATGNPQLYGLASASNRDWKVVGETPREALRAFAAELRDQRYAQNLEGAGDQVVLVGPVKRIGHEIIDGSSTYYMTLSTVDRKAFRVPASINVEVALTNAGDTVEMTAYDTDAHVIEVLSFDNQAITLEKSDGQKAVEAAVKKVRQQQADETTQKRFERQIDGLSIEEKRKLLDTLDQSAPSN
ncbi:hypothetical protein CKO28_01470 [Rhodovibrio sodomensis]|uniref:Uncharacterized protein n=1 Tax=Rhodovibrio sodomensis TaxID=1088 RepID=A0ABS1D8G7_9PROT|nr:hypothetical protein [Rhodovibrio sodomensis]MBK1666714.1 hypothetical protein [Rhodovibrio sodomensis]